MSNPNVDQSSKAGRAIQRSIQRIVGVKKWSHTHVFIQCPFHNDRTPSCSINIDGTSGVPIGWCRCFGCGKSVHWNILAAKLGLDKIEGSDFKKDRTTETDFEEVRGQLLSAPLHTFEEIAKAENYGLSIPYPSHKEWRGIPGVLLHDLGAKVVYDERSQDTAVLLPISVQGKIRGIVKASRVKQEKSYITSQGGWIKSYGLFPFDYAIRNNAWDTSRTLALVEGPRDALRLLKYKIPAMAILGSQSWSERKRNLILSLSPKNIVLMFDSDQAGIKATNNVRKDLLSYMKPKVIKMAHIAKELGVDSVDPGDIPVSYIKRFRAEYFQP